jgi:hydrogenase maturation protease
MPQTLVLGLGNPLLGDDGVGWRIIEALRQLPEPFAEAVELDCHAGGGLSLMERLVGYERAVVIDALQSGREPIGTVTCQPLDALPDPSGGHLSSAHETSLQTALAVGRLLGAPLPSQVTVIGIEAPPTFDFSEDLTPPVARAVPIAAGCAIRHLRGESA